MNPSHIAYHNRTGNFILMKTKTIIILTLTAALWFGAVSGTHARDSVYIRAMQEEVQRGMESLVIDRMLPPGFISYHIVDANTLQISSVLGGIVRSQERRIVRFENRTLILREGVSNENFLDIDNLGGTWSRHENNIPVTGTEDDVRRSLWLVTDEKYKNALGTYESKISAMKQQSLTPEELELPDFLPAPRQEIVVPYEAMDIDKTWLEDLARSISAVFAGYGKINMSQVNIYVYDGQVYYHNSEGTLAQYPFQVAAVLTTASAQSSSGELLFEHSLHFAKDLSEIPAKAQLVSEARKIAGYLEELTGTMPVTEPYFGPVLFEGQAVAEVFAKVFFGDADGLIAVRKPIVGDEQIVRFAPDWIFENNLEAMMGRRIISRDISIDALPGLAVYQGENLFGSFMVDAEGLPAVERVNLVEEGVLSGLLSTRVPTLGVKVSNAHARLALARGSVRTVTAPGVVKMSVNEDVSYDMQELKELLIRQALYEGLDYAYIVRKVVSPAARFAQEDDLIFRRQTQQNRDLPKTIQVSKVYVEDGREEPVSMAEIKGLNIRSFRRILGSSRQMQVYNTMFTPANVPLYGWDFDVTGVPVSYIVPNALLFEELDVVREPRQVVNKPPVVENPVNR